MLFVSSRYSALNGDGLYGRKTKHIYITQNATYSNVFAYVRKWGVLFAFSIKLANDSLW